MKKALAAILFVMCLVPQVASATPPKVAAVGDLGCDGDHVVRSYSRCHGRAVSDLVFRHHYDAFLPLGDVQYECASSYDLRTVYGPTFGRVMRITHPAVGNHEYWAHAPYQWANKTDHCDFNASGYYRYFGQRAHRTGTGFEGAYSYRLGHWLLIALNSECAYGAGNTGSCAQESAWLSARMGAWNRNHHGRSCTLAYWHKPPLSVAPYAVGVTRGLFSTFANHGGDVVLTGHDHLFAVWHRLNADGQRTPRGTRLFTIGTGGKGFEQARRQDSRVRVRQDRVPGLLRLYLAAHGYRWRFMPIKGRRWTASGYSRCH